MASMAASNNDQFVGKQMCLVMQLWMAVTVIVFDERKDPNYTFWLVTKGRRAPRESKRSDKLFVVLLFMNNKSILNNKRRPEQTVEQQ